MFQHAPVVNTASLALLVILGFGLRFTQLSAIGFAEDEMNKLDAVHSYERGDFSANAEHPMVMKMLMWASLRAGLGDSDETALRLPNVLIGSLTVIPLFLLTAALFDRRHALLAAAFWAFGINAITHNRIGKEDTLLVFFMLFAFYFFIRAKQIRPSDKLRRARRYAASAVSFGLMIASKYFPHYVGLNMLFHHNFHVRPATPGEPGGRTPGWFFLVIIGVYLVASPAVLLPQNLGTDVVTLFVGIPLLAVTAVATRRGSLRARLLWLGALGYLAYDYGMYALGVRWNPLFLLYAALFGLSLYALITGLVGTDAEHDLALVSWYALGTRVLDLSGLVGLSAGVSEEMGSQGFGIREVAYDAMLGPRKALLHRQVAEAMEALVPDREAHAYALGRHYRQAGAWDKVVTYFRQAGSAAISRSAYREALACFEDAREALRHLARTRDTLESAIDVSFDLRTALYPLGEFQRTLAYLREAEPLAETLDDAGRRGRIAAYICVALRRAGDLEGAIEAGERALSLAGAMDDVSLRVATTLYLGQALWFTGSCRRSAEIFRKNVDLLTPDRLRQRHGAPGYPGVFSMTDMSNVLAELGGSLGETLTIVVSKSGSTCSESSSGAGSRRGGGSSTCGRTRAVSSRAPPTTCPPPAAKNTSKAAANPRCW